jgi:hypothetical protein
MSNGYSNKCKNCRKLWHRKYREATHSDPCIDVVVKNIIKITSKTISDEECKKMLDVVHNLRMKSKVTENYSWQDLKILRKSLIYFK